MGLICYQQIHDFYLLWDIKWKKCDSGHTWRSGSGCHVYGGGTGTRALGSRNKGEFGPSLCPTVVDALVGWDVGCTWHGYIHWGVHGQHRSRGSFVQAQVVVLNQRLLTEFQTFLAINRHAWSIRKSITCCHFSQPQPCLNRSFLIKERMFLNLGCGLRFRSCRETKIA